MELVGLACRLTTGRELPDATGPGQGAGTSGSPCPEGFRYALRQEYQVAGGKSSVPARLLGR